VIAYTRDGRRLEKIEPINRGNPDHPLRPDEVVAKFRTNAATRLPAAAAETIERLVMSIEAQDSLDELLRAVTPR
jgi:hypothetical protein